MPVVVIVGSGMAAVSAARDLSRCKGMKVKIVEALDRMGGRINTVNLHGHNYDLGASWLHETLVNPLFKLALSNDIRMGYDDKLFRFYFKGESMVSLDSRAHRVVNDVLDSIALDYNGHPSQSPPDTSVKDYTVKYLNSAPLITDEQRQLAAHMIQKVEHYTAQPWDHVPVGEAVIEGLGRNALVLDGMKQIWDLVWKQANRENIEVFLKEPVTRIAKIASSEKYLIETNQRSHEADFVLCTMSMGALKTNSVEFDPPLTEKLTRSIANTDVAKLGKVIMGFSTRFWHSEPDEMHVMSRDSDVLSGGVDESSIKTHPVSFVNAYNYFDPARGPVLVALTGPPVTQCIENMSRSQVLEFLKPYIEPIRCNVDEPVPEPEWLFVTSWSKTPQFMGSYSARSIGQTYSEMVDPFIEGMGNLRFAGEHTVYEGSGCVHGAYLSGVREAAVIALECDDVVKK